MSIRERFNSLRDRIRKFRTDHPNVALATDLTVTGLALYGAYKAGGDIADVVRDYRSDTTTDLIENGHDSLDQIDYH